jgi:hypothetical protein
VARLRPTDAAALQALLGFAAAPGEADAEAVHDRLQALVSEFRPGDRAAGRDTAAARAPA